MTMSMMDQNLKAIKSRDKHTSNSYPINFYQQEEGIGLSPVLLKIPHSDLETSWRAIESYKWPLLQILKQL